MNTDKKVIRLEPLGPDEIGMSKMDLDPNDFQSELPLQHIHVYYENQAMGLTVGVWDTTSMQEAFGPYPGDEFMWILEGNVRMMDTDENETIVNQGESFCVRNAIPISWKQEGFLQKIFMTYADPNSKASQIESAKGGVKVLDPELLTQGLRLMETTDPFIIEGDLPQQRDSLLFTNDAGNMFVGMWDSTPFESEMRPFPCHEFVQLLEGEIIITEEDGSKNVFKAGESFFVPMGTPCRWETSEYVRKFYSILDPGITS